MSDSKSIEADIAEIERDLSDWNHPLDSPVAQLFYKHCGALIRDLRALRAQNVQLRNQYEGAVSDFAAEINRVRDQLAQAEKERDDLDNRSYQTVVFPCGCIFKQDGLDAEPQLIKHCNVMEATQL